MIVEARFGVTVLTGGDCSFFKCVVTQKRNGTPLITFFVDLDFDSTRWNGIMSQVRWTASRIVMDGKTYLLTRTGELDFAEGWDPARQKTFKLHFVGDIFAIPTTSLPSHEPDPCPPLPVPVPVPHNPKLWGNRLIEAWLSYGTSPLKMRETKIFKGLTTTKEISGDTAIKADVEAVDWGLTYSQIPLCFELQPFAGFRRGEITKMVAATLGIDAADIICPPGNKITKPLLLTNASLIPFLNDFWAPEDGWVYFNEDGKLVVEIIELKDDPDFTMDVGSGDWDFDTFKEQPPSTAPTQYIGIGVSTIAGDDPDAQELIKTTVTIETDEDFYNPRCVKVRPSGAASYLFADGSYRIHMADIVMITKRVKTEITTRGTITIRRIITTEEWYNPKLRDPNYDTNPTGTSYNGAYGNKTFHLMEAEGFMEVSKLITENFFDDFGTPQRTVESTFGWFNPQTVLVFWDVDHKILKNVYQGATLLPGGTGGGYVFPGGVERKYASEQYGMTQQIETVNTYGEDGTLSRAVKTVRRYDSPESRCDITDDGNPPPPPDQPPPDPGPTPPPWKPVITGPTVQDNGSWKFTVSLPAGFPLGESPATFAISQMYREVGGTYTGVIGFPELVPPSSVPGSTWTEGQSFDLYTSPFPSLFEGSIVSIMRIDVDISFGAGPDAFARGTLIFMHP